MTFLYPPDRLSPLERRRRVTVLARANEQRKRLAEAVESAKQLGLYSHAVALGAMHTSLDLAIKSGSIFTTTEGVFRR
jgi:hypothetical protein